MYREWESTVYLDDLKCLNTAQLLDLLEDEETIRDTVRVNSKSRGLQRSKLIYQASNSWLAEQNLIYQPYLAETKLLLAEKHRDLGELVSSVRRKQRKLETLQQRFNLRVIHSSLKEKIDFSLRESKNIWQRFVDGKLLPTDFVESLQNTRKLYHTRLVQVEKIQNLIRQTDYEKDIGHHLTLLQTPTNITICAGISPVIFLPDLHLQTSYLTPLLQHGCVDSRLISNNELDHKQGHCKGRESHKWPQRHFHLQPLKKIYKPKTPK